MRYNICKDYLVCEHDGEHKGLGKCPHSEKHEYTDKCLTGCNYDVHLNVCKCRKYLEPKLKEVGLEVKDERTMWL